MDADFSWSWLIGWLLATALCFLIPVLPALQELRAPGDADPLKIQPEHTGTVDFRAQELSASAEDLRSLGKHAELGEMGNGWLRLLLSKASLEAKTRDSISIAAPVITSLVSLGDVNVEGGRVRKLLQARNVYCQSNSQLGLFTSAKEQLLMESGVRFTKLSAHCIVTVQQKTEKLRLWTRETEVPDIARAHERRVGDMLLAVGESIAGNFVVRGSLTTGELACIDGHVKVHGPVVLGRGTVVTGSLFVHGDVLCHTDVLIGGSLSATGTIQMKTGTQVGTHALPSSVMAQRVLLGPFVQVFGSVSSLSRGRVLTKAEAA